MLTDRLPLIWAFAGGCLSGVLALGLWRAESVVSRPSHASVSRAGDERAEPSDATREAREHMNAEEASAVRAPQHEPAAPPDQERSATSAEGSPSKHDDAEAATEQGSSVADVLGRLESQYRQVLAGTTPPGGAERVTAAPAATPVTAPTAAIGTGTGAVAEAPARELATRAQPVALAATPPQPKSVAPPAAPEPVVPPAEVAEAAPQPPSAAPAEVAQRLAAQSVGQPRDVYLGNVQNNVYLGNVYQGQVVQMQQELAMLQYMQLLSLSPYARLGGRGRGAPRGFASRPAPAPAFHSDLTNPDNPWGFDFPPTNYVK
jgi:hypothetical protein